MGNSENDLRKVEELLNRASLLYNESYFRVESPRQGHYEFYELKVWTFSVTEASDRTIDVAKIFQSMLSQPNLWMDNGDGKYHGPFKQSDLSSSDYIEASVDKLKALLSSVDEREVKESSGFRAVIAYVLDQLSEGVGFIVHTLNMTMHETIYLKFDEFVVIDPNRRKVHLIYFALIDD